MPKSLVRLGLNTKSAELHQKRFEMLDDIAKPFVEINVSTGEVLLSPGLFRQFTVREGTKKQPPAQSTVSKTRLKEAPKPLPKRPKPAKKRYVTERPDQGVA